MKFVLLLIGFLLAAGLCEVRGYSCEWDQAEFCKQDLATYERDHFPFYGSNEEELDETCRAMNETVECLMYFVDNCQDIQDCDETCMRSVDEIHTVARSSGVVELYRQLCTDEHPLRETYLENYECLEKASNKYIMCHNTSQESQKFLMTLYEDPQKHIEATCCFFSWYQDCYTNATIETCGHNNTFFVSFALHLLTGHIISQACKPMVYCDKPPLHSYLDNTIPDSGTSHPVTDLCYVVLLVFVHFAYFLVKNRQ